MADIEKIEPKSEQVSEILGKPPKWLIRWGISVIFIIIAGLFVGSYFFKYPEVLTAQIIVTTENLPADVVAKTNGKIDSLFVHDKQIVKQGELLAIIENSANTDDIMLLSESINNFVLLSSEQGQNPNFVLLPLGQGQTKQNPLGQGQTKQNYNFGDLQPQYNSFQKSLSDYNYFTTTDYHNKKIATINRQIEIQQILLNQGERQLKLQKEQLQIADLQFSRDSNLYVQKVIAQSEYETAKSTKLQAHQSYENAKTSLESQKISILQLEQSIFDLEQQRNEQETQHKLSLNTAFDQLKAQLQAFKKMYFLESPSDGIVTFTKFWQKNQNINAGETVLTVVPNDSAKITGKIYLSPQGAGKVKIGQTANIKFDNFPYMEYGLIRVTIKNIALVPITIGENKFYVLEVDFPCTDGKHSVLTTNYNKTLTFSQQMSGTAEIITEDLRLIDRFLNPIKAIINN